MTRWRRWKQRIRPSRSECGVRIGRLEIPEILFDQAVREMAERHRESRDRAVQVITDKNNLQQMVDDLEKWVIQLGKKAAAAESAGDRVAWSKLNTTRRDYERLLAEKREALSAAIEAAEAIKVFIKQEEERIRQRVVEARVLKIHRIAASIRAEAEIPHVRLVLIARVNSLKNEQQQMMEDLRKQMNCLQTKAELARARGDADLARQLEQERDGFALSLETIREAVSGAIETLRIVADGTKANQ